jgi:hypothetical protein
MLCYLLISIQNNRRTAKNDPFFYEYKGRNLLKINILRKGNKKRANMMLALFIYVKNNV